MKKISDRTRELLDQIGESLIQDLDLDEELMRDCFPLKATYRNQAGEALLTVEVWMKKRLNKRLQQNRSLIAINIIDDARRLGVFKRSDPSEEPGVELLFRGAVLGIRNVLSHNKPEMSKEEAVKIILFADYLINLFETQCRMNKI